jgi:hypothetical protein
MVQLLAQHVALENILIAQVAQLQHLAYLYHQMHHQILQVVLYVIQIIIELVQHVQFYLQMPQLMLMELASHVDQFFTIMVHPV